jgi:arabinan endo-1,5-alpha-L-arabinosidase
VSWIRKPERRLHLGRKLRDAAITGEESVIIFHDGWYYLLVTEGADCAGVNSSCNIRIGRSRKAAGPFIDNMGVDMLQDGEKLFAELSRGPIGFDDFGLLDLGAGSA